MAYFFRSGFSEQVIKAPEPDNIIWEHLEFSKFKRRMRQSITGLVSFILLLIAFVLILAASGVQDHYAEIIPKIAYCQLEVNTVKPPAVDAHRW